MINLAPNERVYLLKRRHPILLKLFIIPLLFLLSFILILVLFGLFYKIPLPEFLVEIFPQLSKIKINFIFAFILSLILPAIWIIIFFEITRYYLTYWVITNQRILEARFISFFNIKYSSIELSKIQDMTVSIEGVFPSLFRFGNLKIETAGEKGEFILNQIENPEIVKQIIFEAKIDYQHQNL